MPGEHARFGGSSIAQTMECPPWVQFCEQRGIVSSESEFADRGTLLHGGMEVIYAEPAEGEDPIAPETVLGREYNGIVLDQDLLDDKILPAMRAMETILEKYGIDYIETEARVTIFDDTWGTGDFLARGEFVLKGTAPEEEDVTLTVGLSLDYKFGDGVGVTAVNNRQGMFYGAAASITPEVEYLFKDLDLFVVAIIQPTHDATPDFSLWEMAPSKLEEFLDEVDEAVTLASSEEMAHPHPSEFKTGKHCRFCPANGACPATTGELQSVLRFDVSAPDVLERLFTWEELERVTVTLKAMKDMTFEQVSAGVDVHGMKIVPTQARRAYIDKAAVEARVKSMRKLRHEDAYVSELLSPAQLEKLCKRKKIDYKKEFEPYIDSISKGVTLVGPDDPRVAPPGMNELAALLDRNPGTTPKVSQPTTEKSDEE